MRWQQQRRDAGLCITCGEPRAEDSLHYCEKHLEISRRRGLANYRRKHGIPVDAPVKRYRLKTNWPHPNT